MKKLEIIFRRLLLNLLLLIKKKPDKTGPASLNSNSRILFIRLNRIGDALVSTPLLYEVKKNLNCHVSILASRHNYFIFNNPSLADEVIVFDKKVKSISSLVSFINEKKYDAIIDLHDDISTTVSYIIAFARCRNKIGLSKGNDNLYSLCIEKPDPSKHHVVERIMKFTEALNIDSDLRKVNIIYNPLQDSMHIAEEFIKKHFKENNFLVGINISAGSDARFWGIARFKELINSISEYGINIVLLCLERDLKSAWEIAGREIPIFYRPRFDEFAAMVKKLDLLFTPDTSIVHLASAFRIPMFGLYVKYNTNDLIWHPYGSPFEAIITGEPNLENVSFEIVNEKFVPFFEKYFYEFKSKTS